MDTKIWTLCITTEVQIPPEIRPIRSLLSAILERALLDYMGTDPREADESLRWIFASYDNETWSFNWICSELDCCPNRIRKEIRFRVSTTASRQEIPRNRCSLLTVTRSRPSRAVCRKTLSSTPGS